jgi:hypothetical protein
MLSDPKITSLNFQYHHYMSLVMYLLPSSSIAILGGNFEIVSRLLGMGVNANPATATAFFNQQIGTLPRLHPRAV